MQILCVFARFLVGLFLAILYKNQGPQKKEFVFKETEFDLMFDEDGTFNPNRIEESNKD